MLNLDTVKICSVFFKFLSSGIFVKSRQLWDLINIISSTHLTCEAMKVADKTSQSSWRTSQG